MTQWLYPEAGKIYAAESTLGLNLVNPQFQAPVQAFCTSLRRMRQLWELAPSIDEAATKTMIAWMTFILQEGRTAGVSGTENIDRFLEMTRLEFLEQIRRKAAELGNQAKAVGFNRVKAIERFDRVVGNFPELDTSIRAIFECQIILTWSAFETLAGDLWAGAIVWRPALRLKKAHFGHLMAIRETYRNIEPASPTIDALLTDPSLRKSSLVRDLIVHKCGKVDQEFLEGAAEILWDSGETINEQIRIDGARIKELVGPTIKTAQQLARAIDGWATSQKRTPPRKPLGPSSQKPASQPPAAIHARDSHATPMGGSNIRKADAETAGNGQDHP